MTSKWYGRDIFRGKKWRGYELWEEDRWYRWNRKSYKLMSNEELLEEFRRIRDLDRDDKILDEIKARGIKVQIKELLDKSEDIYYKKTKIKILKLLNSYDEKEIKENGEKIISWIYRVFVATHSYWNKFSDTNMTSVISLLLKSGKRNIIKNKENVKSILIRNRINLSSLKAKKLEATLNQLIKIVDLLNIRLSEVVEGKEDLLIAYAMGGSLSDKLKKEIIKDDSSIVRVLDKIIKLSANVNGTNQRVSYLLDEISEEYGFEKMNKK